MESSESGRAEKIRRLAACFGAGDFIAAETIARQLNTAGRRDEEALHLLAQIVFRQERTEEAIELMRAVLDIDPARASYNNDYGVMLASAGRWDEAAAAYGMAAVLDRNSVDARFNLALALFRTKQNERARAELDQILALWPDLPDALALNGELLHAEGLPAKAVEAFTKAIERGLETPEVYLNLGLALEDMSLNEEAAEALLQAGVARSGSAEACFHLGNLHRDKGDKAQAEHLYRQALALCPDRAEPLNNLGLLLLEKGDKAQAETCFTRALASNPGLDAAYTNLGNLRAGEGLMESAIDSIKQALKINPHSADAWNNLGLAYLRLQRLKEAEEALRRALEIRPDYDAAVLNLTLLLLLDGRFREAWPGYENRWKKAGVAEKQPKFKQPEWTGEDLGERTLLVYSEQGLGDSLQFIRYLPFLRRRYPRARICFWSQPQLYRLFASNAAAWGVEVLPPLVAGGLPPFDVQIALLSLPWRMDTTLESIPNDIPYIIPPAKLAEKWSARLESLPGRKVGVVWASGETYEMHKSRTVLLKQLEPLLGVGGISWVSLQKGGGASQIVTEGLSESILDVMDEVEDFSDTAAIVAQLDLVISVDTSVPHLAGAMGKPVWLLDRFNTDWRWLLDREDSPWYPTMRIFRQTSFGDWDSVMTRAAEALGNWVMTGGGDPAQIITLPKKALDGKAAASKANDSDDSDNSPGAAGTQASADAAVIGQVFGNESLEYRIVHARHGWMLANPNDVYIGQALLEYGEYSESEAGFLLCLLKPGRIVEVGANMGGLSVGLAKVAAARGEEMVVFEPQPVVFQNLCANLALNGLQNVRAWPFACGDETSVVTFAEQNYGRPGNFGGVEMSRTETLQGRIQVPCVRLDDFLGGEAVALIKVDVEGFELAVLRGAGDTLKRWRPVLYVENDRAAGSKDLIEWLWSREYRLFWHITQLFNPNNFFGQRVNRFGTVASYNMICMPKELLQGDMPGLDEIVDSSKHPLLA